MTRVRSAVWTRKVVVAAAIGLALAATGALVVTHLFDADALRPTIERQAARALGRPVTIGAVDWSVWPRLRMVLADVEVGSPPAMVLRRVELTTGLRGLLSKRVENAGLIIAGSRIELPLALSSAGGDAPRTPSAADDAAASLVIASIDRISLTDIVLAAGGRQVRLDAESALQDDRLVVSGFRLTSGKTAIEGRGEFSSLAARRGMFTAAADVLDLDEVIAMASAVAGPADTSPAARGDVGDAGRDTPLDVRLDLEAGRGRWLGIDLASLATRLIVGQDSLTLEPFRVSVFDGTLAGRLHMDAVATPASASLSATAAGIDVARLAAFAGSAGVITGRLGGRFDLQAPAGAPDAVFRTAKGRGTLQIEDGTIPGLDLVAPIILAFGRPDETTPRDPSRAFSMLGGTFVLAGGVLRSDDVAMTSRDVDLAGRGTLRAAGAVVDVHADLVLSEALSARAGRDLYRYARQGSRIVLPATITGTLASPTVSVDVASALQRAARNALEDRLRKALGRLRKR